MQRLLYDSLIKWKDKPGRKPLIIQGVRQCGKTWLIQNFGEHEFQDTAYFNFEYTETLNGLFENDLDINRIITNLGILRNKTIRAGKTLLILDEIQKCPRAITSLKYFAEKLPELHIIAAGSLLGVAVAQMGENISYPVGKVEHLTLYPLNFAEYLMANGEELLYNHLKNLPENEEVPDSFTYKLEELYRNYLITGGMPAVVNSWIENHSIDAVESILEGILSDYEKDFVKYAPDFEFPKLTLIWHGIPKQLAQDNQKFMFSHLKTGMRARDLEDSLSWLVSAGLIYNIQKAEHPNIPLTMYADITYFKIYLSDAGLLRKMSRYPADALFDVSPQTAYMRGALAENYVLTELISGGFEPYFWKSKGIAEVDFIVQNKMNVVPIEVKSGKNTRSRSLGEYRKKYSPKISIRTSLQELKKHEDDSGIILELPLYLIWNLKSYLAKQL